MTTGQARLLLWIRLQSGDQTLQRERKQKRQCTYLLVWRKCGGRRGQNSAAMMLLRMKSQRKFWKSWAMPHSLVKRSLQGQRSVIHGQFAERRRCSTNQPGCYASQLVRHTPSLGFLHETLHTQRVTRSQIWIPLSRNENLAQEYQTCNS